MTSLLIFDLDDTLVDTSDVYFRARSRFAEALAEEGLDEHATVALFEAVDTENMRTYGFSPARYGQSMRDVCARMEQRLGRRFSEKTRRKVDLSGRLVLTCLPSLLPGARNLLAWAAKEHMLALLTRGDRDLQEKKINEAGIASFFHCVETVTEKRSSTFAAMMTRCGFDSGKTWVIGDSIKADVNPGIELGARSILYLYRHDHYVWRQEYGHQAVGKFYVARSLGDVRRIIESPSSFPLLAGLAGIAS